MKVEHDGSIRELSQHVSQYANSTTTMALHDITPEEKANCITPASNLLSGTFSRGRRKHQDEEDEEFYLNKLEPEEKIYLTQQLDDYDKEINVMVALQADGQGANPPTVLELCCEEDSAKLEL